MIRHGDKTTGYAAGYTSGSFTWAPAQWQTVCRIMVIDKVIDKGL